MGCSVARVLIILMTWCRIFQRVTICNTKNGKSHEFSIDKDPSGGKLALCAAQTIQL